MKIYDVKVIYDILYHNFSNLKRGKYYFLNFKLFIFLLIYGMVYNSCIQGKIKSKFYMSILPENYIRNGVLCLMKKDNWSSETGFILAAAGSAVGLGNIWKFPYIAGQNGGAVFIIIYFILLLLLGVPVLLSEMAIGRKTGKNPIDACRTLHRKCGFIGGFGILGAFVILSYYCIIGGWIIKYLLMYMTGGVKGDYAALFERFTTGFSPVIYGIIFTLLCTLIVIKGISGGIEKISRIFMPALLVMMIVLIIKSLSLKGGGEGVKFFLLPDFTAIESAGDFLNILVSAMGQVFFSLSLGMGTLITYGAYLDRKTSLKKAAFCISLIDFFIAVLAGLMVLPAVFAYGIAPQAGSGMVFIAMPQVFAGLTGGNFWGILFFLLVLFAAVTSAISLFEVLISFLIERFKLKRFASSLICSAAVTAVSVPVALSFGSLSRMRIMGMDLFEFMNFLSDKLLMPLGALGISVLCGYLWGAEEVSAEAGLTKSWDSKLYRLIIRYAAPVMIAVIFVTSFIGL